MYEENEDTNFLTSGVALTRSKAVLTHTAGNVPFYMRQFDTVYLPRSLRKQSSVRFCFCVPLYAPFVML